MRVGITYKEDERIFEDYADAMDYIDELMDKGASDGEIEVKYYV